MNPPELPINDRARNDAHMTSTGVRDAAVLEHSQGSTSKSETKN